MKTRLVTVFALAAGLAAAQGWRDIRQDYARADAIRADIARDQARLNEDIRCGRREAAWRDRADINRDRARLDAQYRDIRHDRYERGEYR